MQPDELLKLAKKDKLNELETAWIAVAAEGTVELRYLLPVLTLLAERDRADTAESLGWYLVDALREAGKGWEAFEAARGAALAVPGSELLREALSELYVAHYSTRDEIEELVLLTLGAAEVPTPAAVESLENFLSFRHGIYVLDPQHGEVGRVERFDSERGGMVVAFGETEKVYGGGLLGRLRQVEQDDFRALAVFERDRLTALAAEDPEEFVTLVLDTLDRRMELRRLRLYIEPILGSWSKWWTKAKRKLARSAMIGMTAGRSPALFLRSRPLSRSERMVRRFDALEEPSAALAMALEILQEGLDHGNIEPEHVQHVVEGVLSAGARAASRSPQTAFAAGAVADAFARRFEAVQLEDTFAEGLTEFVIGDPAGFAGTVTEPSVVLCALEEIRRRAPERWRGFCASVMPMAGRTVCTALARQLHAEGAADVLAEACREILAHNGRNPGALTWLWRECASAPQEAPVEPVLVATELIGTAAALMRMAEMREQERRDHINDIRTSLFIRDGEPLREALAMAAPEQLAVVKAMAEFNPGLTPGRLDHLNDMLRKMAPDLYEKALPLWQQGVIYTTEAGIARRKADLEQIVHVRLPKVISELGAAANFGDLSENAEYKAALEERTRLADQAARIQQELAEARVIRYEDAAVDYVTIGSRVRLRNLNTGQEEQMTFLGPWDAAIERGIYAFNAPLGLAFMGRDVGEEVSFDTGEGVRRWEVLEVAPATEISPPAEIGPAGEISPAQ